METISQQVWKILDMLQWGTEYLTKRQVSEPRLSMEWILAKVLEVKRLDLYLQFDRPLDATQLAQIKELLQKRARHVPLQYILGQWDFWGLPFSVNPNVLIPRPETEILVESMLNVLGKDAISNPTYGLDLGTGSGNIAVAMLANLPQGRCVAVEISAKALEQARCNAQRHAVLDRLELRRGDWFDALGQGECGGRCFDWIVSNPPYVPDEQWESLPSEVRLHEPQQALCGGPGGLQACGSIVAGASDYLKDGGLLALEIGEGQAAAVKNFIERAEGLNFLEAKKDNNGTERVILVRRARKKNG